MNILQTKDSILFYDKFENNELLEKCILDMTDKLVVNPKSKIYNKEITFHRSIGFFSDTSIGYKYTNQIQTSIALSENMKILLDIINNKYNTVYNSILVNKYNDGSDYIGKHSDDEKYLDKSGVLAISYGATRIFRVRNKSDNVIVLDVNVNNGDILIMKGEFQKEFTHEIPVQKKVKNCRYSLTFRKHLI